MKVELLNPSEVKDLFYWWGIASKVCYDTKTNTPEKIGKGCMSSEHYSGSRARYILFQIDDCPRFVIDQAVRHETGVMKNVQSLRYVGKHFFAYETPEEIKDNKELLNEYSMHMMHTMALYGKIQNYVFNKTHSQERANEQARYVLPISTHSSFVFGMTIEALIHFCNVRLCVRAEDTIRELARLMKSIVIEVLPELEGYLVPSCQAMLWCPEGKHGCGAYPSKKELKEMIDELKSNK